MWDSLTRDEKIQKIKEGKGLGLSSAQMARIHGVTRNMIIGLAHRAKIDMGIKPAENFRPDEEEPREPRPAAKRKAYVRKVRPAAKKLAPAPFPVAAPEPIRADGRPGCRIHLLNVERNDHRCRWPMWPEEGSEHMFCGEYTLGDAIYCPDHRMRAANAYYSRKVAAE